MSILNKQVWIWLLINKHLIFVATSNMFMHSLQQPGIWYQIICFLKVNSCRGLILISRFPFPCDHLVNKQQVMHATCVCFFFLSLSLFSFFYPFCFSWIILAISKNQNNSCAIPRVISFHISSRHETGL